MNLPKKIELPNINPTATDKKKARTFKAYANRATAALGELKKQVETIINEGYKSLDHTGLGRILKEEAQQQGIDFTWTPSQFLNQAYTQAQDGVPNRDQACINAGITLSDFFKPNTKASKIELTDYSDISLLKDEELELTNHLKNIQDTEQDLAILNDAGKLISIMNTTLTQINTIKTKLTESGVPDAFELLPSLEIMIHVLKQELGVSKLLVEPPQSGWFTSKKLSFAEIKNRYHDIADINQNADLFSEDSLDTDSTASLSSKRSDSGKST
jgi:hypothetical protein